MKVKRSMSKHLTKADVLKNNWHAIRKLGSYTLLYDLLFSLITGNIIQLANSLILNLNNL